MNKPTAKVRFKNESGLEETLWAFNLGNHVYRIAYPPFFTYGISYQDEVVAAAGKKGGIPEFVRLYRKSGNRTVRITGDKKIGKGYIREEVLEDMKALGCGVKGKSRKYVSVNVPENVDLRVVADYLIAHNQLWEYADPTLEEIHRSKK